MKSTLLKIGGGILKSLGESYQAQFSDGGLGGFGGGLDGIGKEGKRLFFFFFLLLYCTVLYSTVLDMNFVKLNS